MKYITELAIAVLGFIGLSSNSFAQSITRCGASQGFAYNFQGLLVPSEKSGFQEDTISGGSTFLIREKDQYDIVFVDAIGPKSLKEDGFQIVEVPQPRPGFFMLIAVNSESGITQHYLFQLDTTGDGNLVWGSVKGTGGTIAKSNLMHSKCSRP